MKGMSGCYVLVKFFLGRKEGLVHFQGFSSHKSRFRNITRGGDDPKMGAELESDRDVVGEASYMYKGYQDKHFDICPTTQRLRDRLKGGEFGEPDELDLGEWLYQHDVLFGIENRL